MWVIYFDPLDYPQKWVVRLWYLGSGFLTPQPEAYICNSLDEAREALPPQVSSRLNRAPCDEKQIVEMWF